MLGFRRAGSGILEPKRRGDGLSLPRRIAARARARTKPLSEYAEAKKLHGPVRFQPGGSVLRRRKTPMKMLQQLQTHALSLPRRRMPSGHALLDLSVPIESASYDFRVRRLLHFRPRRRSSAQDGVMSVMAILSPTVMVAQRVIVVINLPTHCRTCK